MGKRLIIGLTGGLASGKSTVSEMFRDKGARLIDADKISHELLISNDSVKKNVVGHFGEKILTDGAVDRKKLGEKVFSDPEELVALCRILHPEIIRRIKEEAAKEDGTVVIDAPLLIEEGLNEFVDVVIVVTASDEVKMERAKSRGLSEQEVRRILKNQMSDDEKIKFADYTINNSSDIEITKQGVDKIWLKM